MSAALATIFAFLAPIIKDVLIELLKDYVKERSYKVVEKTADTVKPEAVHSVYNPSEHLDKYDGLLTED